MRVSLRSAAGAAALSLSLSGIVAGAASAQRAPGAHAAEDAAEAAAEAQDEILVTAHAQRGAVATEIPPEVTLNSTAIHALGAADLTEVLEQLAPEIRSGRDAPGRASSTPIVLVNGQRIAGFSSIKDLPPEAIRRIEIFPEKVALEYGYTAQQRVVNVVLRSQYKALTLLGRYTADFGGSRDLYRAKVDYVRIGETGHWNLDFDLSHQDPTHDLSTLSAAGQPLPSPRHTLTAQDDHLTLSGDAVRKIGTVSAELAARIELDALQTLPGLSIEDGDLLTSQGLGNLITGPLVRDDRSVLASTSLTLNGKIGGWRWSSVGRLSETSRETTTRAADSDSRLSAILIPSPGLLGARCEATVTRDCVSTDLRVAGQDVYLNGSPFRLPAGDVNVGLRGGVAFVGIESRSSLDPHRSSLTRDEGILQGNIDVPLTTRDAAIGKLTVGANGQIDQMTTFGGLSTVGASLSWTPTPPVDLLATFTRQDQAPTLMQLAEGTLQTPDLREFDFVQDATSIIHQISGGNDALVAQTSYVTTVRLQVKPLRATDLSLSGEYTRERIHDPIGVVSAATAATMAAFPDRFARSAAGYLTGIDLSPVNFDHRDRQQIRWGLTYSTGFGRTRPDSSRAPTRDQFQIALYETWRLQDEVVLRGGQRALDLLGHDIIGDRGGTPNHEIELQTSVATPGWSVSALADWQTPTSVDSGLAEQDRLTFTQGITLGVRLQLNLEQQGWLHRRLPFLHGSLNLSAENLLGAHIKVHDAQGNVPPAYNENYLRPVERTFRISLRKRFR